MPRNPKAHVRFNRQPSDEDVIAVVQALHNDFKATCEIHIYPDLVGRMFVEILAEWYDDAGYLQSFSSGRFAGGVGVTFVSAMLMELHRVYHQIDRAVAAQPRKVE